MPVMSIKLVGELMEPPLRPETVWTKTPHIALVGCLWTVGITHGAGSPLRIADSLVKHSAIQCSSLG